MWLNIRLLDAIPQKFKKNEREFWKRKDPAPEGKEKPVEKKSQIRKPGGKKTSGWGRKKNITKQSPVKSGHALGGKGSKQRGVS